MPNILFTIKPEFINKEKQKEKFWEECYESLLELSERAKSLNMEFSAAAWICKKDESFNNLIESLRNDREEDLPEEESIESYLCVVTSAPEQDTYLSILLSKFLVDAMISELEEFSQEDENELSDDEEFSQADSL